MQTLYKVAVVGAYVGKIGYDVYNIWNYGTHEPT